MLVFADLEIQRILLVWTIEIGLVSYQISQSVMNERWCANIVEIQTEQYWRMQGTT